MKRDMLAAQASGDIATLMRLIASTSGVTVEDFIKKTCGSLLFTYYTYVDQLHVKPLDLMDMVDGLLYLEAKSYIIKKERKDTEDVSKK